MACYSLRKVQDIQDIQLAQSLPTSIKWLFLFSLECDFIYKLTCMFYFTFSFFNLRCKNKADS